MRPHALYLASAAAEACTCEYVSVPRLTMSANGGHARRGAEISLESLSEWKIQEIGYDGIEKYTK